MWAISGWESWGFFLINNQSCRKKNIKKTCIRNMSCLDGTLMNTMLIASFVHHLCNLFIFNCIFLLSPKVIYKQTSQKWNNAIHMCLLWKDREKGHWHHEMLLCVKFPIICLRKKMGFRTILNQRNIILMYMENSLRKFRISFIHTCYSFWVGFIFDIINNVMSVFILWLTII